MKEEKMAEYVVLIIITIGIIFLILSFVDESPYKNSGEYSKKYYDQQGEQYDQQYDECTPDPIWGGCL